MHGIDYVCVLSAVIQTSIGDLWYTIKHIYIGILIHILQQMPQFFVIVRQSAVGWFDTV